MASLQSVLLDRHLPLVNGLDVLRAIRANGRTKLIPVVMLTASGQQSDINESYQLRVNSYVIKPSDFDQFSEVVGHVARYWVTLNR